MGGNFFANVVEADRQVDVTIAAKRVVNTLPRAYRIYQGPKFGDNGRYHKWQPVATAILHPTSMMTTVIHMDRRLRKLRLNVLPGNRMHRARRIPKELYTLTASRVVVAVLRCFLNGWITQRRLSGTRNCRCRFGCKSGTDDLEHIMRCPVTHQLAESHLQLRPPPVDLRADAFLCMSEALSDGSF